MGFSRHKNQFTPTPLIRPPLIRALATLFVIVLPLLGLWAVLGALSSETTWHYRITVAVKTPEGLKIGAAVREVVYGGPTKGGGGPGLSLRCKGEAVVVDLGQRGLLFALLGGDACADQFLLAFNDKDDATLRPSKVPSHGSVIVSPSHKSAYPIFVRFRNSHDPKTIENIQSPNDMEQIRKEDPRRPLISSEEAFGQGVKIESVTIEMTSAPVTWELHKYISWIDTIGMGNLGGGKFSGPEWYERLSRYAFKKDS